MFHFTSDQIKAQDVVTSDATFIMLFGGSRSGKTFLHVRNIVMRALKAANSRHCILRFRFNHCKRSIVLDTFPKVMQLCFPDIPYKIDKQDWFARFPNNAEIWFGGLDDKERTEKILGNEYVTIFLNECSQISWQAFGIIITRLAQLVNHTVVGMENETLKPKVYADCNPPNKLHWVYQVFIKKTDPDTREPNLFPQNYSSMQLNPEGNAENQAPGYLDQLKNLPARLRKRFLLGEFADGTPNALFSDENIEKYRVISDETDNLSFIRVVVAVDPSGAGDIDNADNDEIGIIVAGLGFNGNAYIIADYTVKAGPGVWGKIVANAYDNHKADLVVGEVNFGGAMVAQTIQVARPRTPFKAVTASRGKHVRADPISALYEDGKVRHIGFHRELEEELMGFTTAGYVGSRSPNRADAMIWAINAIFPAITAPKEDIKSSMPMPINNPYARRA